MTMPPEPAIEHSNKAAMAVALGGREESEASENHAEPEHQQDQERPGDAAALMLHELPARACYADRHREGALRCVSTQRRIAPSRGAVRRHVAGVRIRESRGGCPNQCVVPPSSACSGFVAGSAV